MDEIGLKSEGIRIAHWTPGRIRVSFEDSAAAHEFAVAVLNLQGVTSARSNSLTGTVLVHYTDELQDVRRLLEPLGRRDLAVLAPEQHMCVQCRQPLESVDSTDIIRRLLSLIASIITGDLIGIVSWVIAATDPAYAQSHLLAA